MPDLEKILEKYPFVQRDNLISILQDIQNEFGFLSEQAIVKVGSYLNLPTSKIYGLASFYHHFRFISRGKYHIKVCNGTSCHAKSNQMVLRKTQKILDIKTGQVTKDGLFSLEETTCLAACGQGPIMSINGEYYTHLSGDKVMSVIESYKRLEE